MEEYKLFVWRGDGVLEDWTPGLIVALARNIEEALAMIKEDYPDCKGDFPEDEYETYPLSEPVAFLCRGSS